ncbi:recombinase, partial [Streptococcus suis]
IYNSDKSDRQTVYISERDLDRVISKLIQAEMERLGTIHYLLPKLEAKKEKYISARQSKIKQYKQGLSRLQEGIRDLYTSYSLSEIDRETYLVYKSESEAKVETIS